MKKLLLISTITVAFLAGCAMNNPYATNGADAAIAKAQMKYDKAHKQQVAWKGTAKLLKKARALAAKNPKKAIALANEVAYEADTAIAESAEYDKTWQAAVVK